MIRTHLGPVINRLKYFWIRFRFRRDIRILKSSTVCIPPQSQTLQCASPRWVRLRGVHPTVESSSTMCITPWSQAQRCASHRWVKLCGVHHTVESNCTLRSQNRNLCESLIPFKGTIRRNSFKGEHIQHERKDLKNKFWLAKPKILTPRCDTHAPQSRIFRTLGSNISPKSKPNSKLACLSGAQMGQNHEKNKVENVVTHSP